MVEENAAFFAGMTGMHRYDGVDDNRDNSMDWADNYTSTFANLPSLSYASSLFDVQDHNYAASLYSPGLQWTPTNDFDVGNYTEHPFTGTQVLGLYISLASMDVAATIQLSTLTNPASQSVYCENSAAPALKPESRHHPEVPASRLKKRELDRKAQRAARKRTQDRIVQLEELVAHLSRNDINAEASRLMERLLQTTQERDKLMGVLSSLGATIRHHTDTFSAQSKVSLSSVVGAMVSPSDLPEDVQPSDQTHTLEEGPASPLSRNEYVTPGTCFPPPPANASCEFDTPEKPIIAGKPMMTSYSRHVVQNLDEVKQTPITLLRSDSELSQETNSFGNSFIIPQSPQPCHCSTVLRVNQRNPNPNIWRLANHALGRPVKMSPLAIEDEDRASQDTPVRAIVEGWESVERAGMMTDSWRKLRIIDGLCLSKCGPGVRERFVFSQHHYCANIFWHLFGSSLTILWQFGFNNCFMKDTVTGRFQLSPFFEDRIRDINSWTMNVDFFDHFPELCDDIPIYGGIPPKLAKCEHEALRADAGVKLWSSISHKIV
ncbi:hypothetical protein HYQ45_018903 [Verticillium longisporum]|uniref:BZIP domain-containing protein n=1 Tax=Verticillium longisporum TaxID=100787 RepID=A0A8I2ZNU5_VERLO|nr:hypothetical protein HYQ45_018903 [Verticillium longisporum]